MSTRQRLNILIILCVCVLLVPFKLSAQGKDYLIKGKNLLITKDYEKAKLSFREALDLGVSASDSAVCYFGIAICSAMQNDNTAAKIYIRKALQISPSFSPEISGIKDFADQNTLRIFDEIKREILGKVSIESEPSGLDIYFDGSLIGKTPKQIDNVLAGKHTIKVAGETKNITVDADRTNKLFFTIKKPENVRNKKCFGVSIYNSALLDLSCRNWLTDFSTGQIDIGIRGLGSTKMDFTLSFAYLRHIFPDYAMPRSLVWGTELRWLAVSDVDTARSFKGFEPEIRPTFIVSFIIGSDFYFKRSPLAINSKVHIELFFIQVADDPVNIMDEGKGLLEFGFWPKFSYGLSYYF